jgi:hypothetical protein
MRLERIRRRLRCHVCFALWRSIATRDGEHRAIRWSDKIFTPPYEQRVGGRQGSWPLVRVDVDDGGGGGLSSADSSSTCVKSFCSDQISHAETRTWLRQHGLRRVLVFLCAQRSHTMLLAPDAMVGYAKCNAAEACPTPSGP